MVRDERGIRITDLGIGSIHDLLQTSKDAIRAYRIPIRAARWYPTESRLAYSMMTSRLHQGHPDICFGGFMDVALHTVTGVAASIRARGAWGKPVLAQVLVVLYKRPVPVNHRITVEAVTRLLPFHRSISFGKILDGQNSEKILSRGIMWLVAVDRVRTQR
jgi:hypothetical protein